MTKITKGDKVRCISQFPGITGVVVSGAIDCVLVILNTDSKTTGWVVQDWHRDHDGQPLTEHVGKQAWWFTPASLEKIEEPKKSENITLGVPSIAKDLKLKPQARKVLAHLLAGKNITPLKAQNVYGVYRLAASIREIRLAGYNVVTNLKKDEGGHQYAKYTLAA